MMKRRITGVMIALLALSAIFAATVTAAGENAGLIANSTAGQVYFGNKADGVTPALYRVAAIDGDRVTLLYDGADIGAGRVSYKNAMPWDWVTSNVCTYLNSDTFLTKAGVFTNAERNVISNYGTTEETPIGTIDISQKILIPSYMEITQFSDYSIIGGDIYWLRSTESTGNLCITTNIGVPLLSDLLSPNFIRPIMKLDRSKILYSTPTVGGKAGDGYVSVNPTDGVKKLTLIDTSLSLLSVKSSSLPTANVLTMIHYNGATPGKTLAALIVRKSDGAVLSRLKITDNIAASGGFGFVLPSDYNSTEQSLKFVVETVNGDNQTDYASQPVDVTLMTFDERMTTYGSGSIIALTEDETFPNSVILDNKDITIDLAGKKLTYLGADQAIQVLGNSHLRIYDSVGGGSINATNIGIHVSQNATLTLEAGVIFGSTSVLAENEAVLTISGSTLAGQTALVVNGGSAAVHSGNFTGITTVGADGVLEIDGGMFAAIQNNGSVIISGGSIYLVNGAIGGENLPLFRYKLHLGEAGKQLLTIGAVPALGYEYHTTDVVTNADDDVFVWLPAGVTNVNATTADGFYSGKAVVDGDGFVVALLHDSTTITAEINNKRKLTNDAQSVSFSLTNPVSGVYKVYGAEAAEEVLDGVSVTLEDRTLTLAANTGALVAGTYYISLTQPNCNEGTRTAFHVTEAPEKPVYAQIEKSSYLYYRGNSVTPLTVSATVTDGGTVTYEWYQNTVNDFTGAVSLGATGNSYTPLTQSIGVSYYFVVATNTIDTITTSTISDGFTVTTRAQEDTFFFPPAVKYAVTATASNSSLFGNLESVPVTANAATAFGNNTTVVIGDFKGISTTFLTYIQKNLRVSPFTVAFYIKSTSTPIVLKNANSVSLTLPLPKELVSKKDSLQLLVDTAGTPTDVAKTFSESNGVTYITFAVKSAGTYAFVTENTWVNPFTDVKTTDKFFDAVRFVSERGLMIGTATTLFSPDTSISRGMISTILYRLAGVTEQGPSGFSDVSLDAYYANAVYWAEKQGLVNGYGNGKFGPNDNITREQLITILWRSAGKPEVSQDALVGFIDWEGISSYANPAIAWAVKVGIVTEKSGESFNPKKIATRAETAEWLYRYVQLKNNSVIS